VYEAWTSSSKGKTKATTDIRARFMVSSRTR
jgi:hypothetical protein